MGEIDFRAIADEALRHAHSLLPTWFPSGFFEGKRHFKVGGVDGSAGESLVITLTGSKAGVWQDFANKPDCGRDLISLYAAHRGIEQGEAAKELGDQFRMGPPPKPAKVNTRPGSDGKHDDDDGVAILPVPADAPKALFRLPPGADWGRENGRWPYENLDGNLMFYAVRFDKADGSKDLRPYTFREHKDGKKKWRWKWPPKPIPLYGLPRLRQRPEAHVLLVEGEKKADAGQRLLPDLVVLGWPGGVQRAISGHLDLSVLAGRKVLLWPDADRQTYEEGHPGAGLEKPREEQPGWQAMAALADQLKGVASGIRIVVPPADRKDGWDIADAEDEGWTQETVATWIREHLHDPHAPPPAAEPEPEPTEPEAPPVDETPPVEPLQEPDEPTDDDVPVLASTQHYTPLGYDRSTYFYLAHGTRQVLALEGHRHSKLGLIQLAPLRYWEREYAGEKGPRWDAAADACMQSCTAVGVWDPARVRGRGCWWDRGRMVIHLGDRLVVDGQPMATTAIRSGKVYEGAAAIPGPAEKPLTAQEARRIVEIAKQFRWEMPASAALICGWIALAPICGALRWRPHIWLTGGSGSGKTTVLEAFLAPLCAGTEIRVQGASTEAGIRQTLRADARPVLIDESEANDLRERQRMDSIITLIRQSSSESGAKTLRGTTGGSAMSFHIRSMFALSSIGVSISRQEDMNRIAVLSLRGGNGGDPKAKAEHWRRLEADLDAMAADRTLPRRLLARIVSMVPVVQKNIRTFVRVAAAHFGNQRLGDQYGTLLAGCYALWSDGEATEDQARDLIGRFDWTTYTEEAEDDQSALCLSSILQAQVRVDQDRGAVTATLGELVAAVARGGGAFSAVAAEAVLLRHGIRVQGRRLLVANCSDALERLLRDTRWASGWGKTLKRLPGATREGTMYFAQGHLSRATGIPIEAAIGRDTTPEFIGAERIPETA